MKRPEYDPEVEPLPIFLQRQDEYINYLKSRPELPSEEELSETLINTLDNIRNGDVATGFESGFNTCYYLIKTHNEKH